jgi:hypothetical protein
VIKLTVVVIQEYNYYKLHTKFYPLFLPQGEFHMQMKLLGNNGSITDQIYCVHLILEKKWEYNGTVHQLFIDFKKACNSVRREVLYNILNETGLPMKLVRLTEMC